MRTYFAAALALVTTNYAWPSPTAEPVLLTLCTLSSTPEKYDGLLVRVRARVLSDGIERTVLVDVNPTCRYGGAALAEASGVKDPGLQSNLERIEATIFSGRHPGTTNKFIRGDFVGVFRLTTEPPMRKLEVRSVANLKITLFGDERQ